MKTVYAERPLDLIRELVATNSRESLEFSGDDGTRWRLVIAPHIVPGYYFVVFIRNGMTEGAKRAVPGYCIEDVLRSLRFEPAGCTLQGRGTYAPAEGNVWSQYPRSERSQLPAGSPPRNCFDLLRSTKRDIASSPEMTNVYVIQAENGGPVKIGRSDAPQTRLQELQCGNPYRLRIVLCFSDVPSWMERSLHLRLEKYRVRNEWFSEDVLTLVTEIVSKLMVGAGFSRSHLARMLANQMAIEMHDRARWNAEDAADWARKQLMSVADITQETLGGTEDRLSEEGPGQQVKGAEPTEAAKPPLVSYEDLL